MRLILILICISGCNLIFAQKFSIIAGVNLGAPMPTQFEDSSKGKIYPGIHAGFKFRFPINDQWVFMPELYYSFKGVGYQQSYTKDTLVSIVIFDKPGQVPSFYTAHIKGTMKLHYFDLPLLLCYHKKRITPFGGGYLSYLFNGYDKGDVRVIIGEGGFYDDYTQKIDNGSKINKWDFGLILGCNIKINKRWAWEMKINRSLHSLYKTNVMGSGNDKDIKLYHTYLHFSIEYRIQ